MTTEIIGPTYSIAIIFGGDMRILVVEGDDGVRTTVCRILQGAGIETVAAVSLADARAHLASGGFDVVLSALLLRGHGSGLEVAYAAARHRVRCVIMSGSPRLRPDIIAAGARFLARPCDRSALLTAVGQADWPQGWQATLFT